MISKYMIKRKKKKKTKRKTIKTNKSKMLQINQGFKMENKFKVTNMKLRRSYGFSFRTSFIFIFEIFSAK